VPIENACENGGHSVVIKLVDSDRVEMAQESRRDRVATATYRQPSEQYMHAVNNVTTKYILREKISLSFIKP